MDSVMPTTLIPTGSSGFQSSPRLNGWTSPLITGLLFSSLTVGTGGAITPTTLIDFTAQIRTSGACDCGPRIIGRETDDESVVSTAEQLTVVQNYLSLNTTELAQALNVSRPTVYSWLKHEQEPHVSNFERIGLLYECARAWERLSAKPLGTFVRQPVFGGQSLLQILSVENLDMDRARQALEAFSRVSAAQAQRSTRKRAAYFESPEHVGDARLIEEFGM